MVSCYPILSRDGVWRRGSWHSGWHEREKSTAQSGLRVEWLEQQLKDKDEMMKVLKVRTVG
jgi:hypothetical protein